MADALQSKLKILCDDYESETGEPFTHFWCPILNVDEDVKLCLGHIINKAFRKYEDYSGARTVQRADVDNWYGDMFEAGFVAIRYDEDEVFDAFPHDKEVMRQFDPELTLNDNREDYYYYDGTDDIPPQFTKVTVKGDHQDTDVVFKMSPTDVQDSEDGNWQLGISKNLALPATVSLIKAAHLTLFELLGYKYARSPAGRYVGHDILGQFFLENRNKPKQEVLANAGRFFGEFVHMVRPVVTLGPSFHGSINDRRFLLCRANVEKSWACIVFVSTARKLHAVLLPIFDDADSTFAYWDFLRNDQDSLKASICQLTDGRFEEIDPGPYELPWEKPKFHNFSPY